MADKTVLASSDLKIEKSEGISLSNDKEHLSQNSPDFTQKKKIEDDNGIYEKPSMIALGGFYSRLTFDWCLPIIKRSHKEQLGIQDFGGLRDEDRIEKKFKELEKFYND